jgi:hypothetical protein
MKIYNFEIPDKLIYKYAILIDDGGVSRIDAHQAIYDYAFEHYEPFKRYFDDMKDVPNGTKLTIESAQEFLSHAEGDLLEICKFTIELDKIIEQIAHKPTASQRHVMTNLLDADDYMEWGR